VVADRRFQHYQGRRLGVAYSFLSLYLHSIGWVLGLKRSARYKIVPALFLLAAFAPAAVIIVVATVAPPDTQLPTYSDYYAFVLPPIYLFMAITMPELICPDRRHGTLRMYMTSNLNPVSYLAAKVLAGWTVLAIVTVLPVLLLLGGYSLFGHGPGALSDAFKTIGQILAAGFELAIFYGTVAMAISSLTDRNSFASAGIILTFVLAGAALGILQGPLKAPDWVRLVNIPQLPTDFMFRIYGVPLPAADAAPSNIPMWQIASAFAGWVLGGLAVLAYRYRGEARK
jgi:ABC-2 type transport system permease protein